MEPAQKKVIALNNPCKYKYTIVIKKLFKTIDANINPQWLIVEYAKSFFISDCDAATTPPKQAVILPQKKINSTKFEYINNVWNFNIKYIPAETKVAEWIRDEAGTGASIESGSHRWPINCADFIEQLISRHTELKTKIFWLLTGFDPIKISNVSTLFTL
jgi:hypothetical protein